MAALFIEKYAKRQTRGWAETERILKKYVTPRWGNRHIADVTRRDVVVLVHRTIDYLSSLLFGMTNPIQQIHLIESD